MQEYNNMFVLTKKKTVRQIATSPANTMNGWTYWTDGWMNVWGDGRVDGQMEERIDG